MAWAHENPFPDAEGSQVYEVAAIWRGERCATKVIGMPRVMWTMAHWASSGHDNIRFKEEIDMIDTINEETTPQAATSSNLALDHILQERRRQDAKWGEQNHDSAKWVLIATEELGELCESLLKEDRPNYIIELTQLAAVTLAWLESEYRRGATIPSIAQKEEAAERSTEQFQIVSMERGETSGSKSPMWRCLTADGDKVNVFKHSDPKRDTFHLFDAAGYGAMMLLMEVGAVLTWKSYPINLLMQKKDSWWNVVNVTARQIDSKPEIGRDDGAAKANAAAWAKALIESDDWLVVDTETTGLNQGGKKDEPVSIAVIDSKGNVLLDTLVNPTISIDDEATAVHGITMDTLATAPRFADIHNKLHQILGSKKLVIYNASFDSEVLINAGRAANVSPVLYGGVLDCAMLKYAEFYGDWNTHHANYKNQSLEKACEQQGITDIDAPAHSARGDCLRTLALIKKMAAYDPHPF